MTYYLSVALDVPLPGLFDYASDKKLTKGTRVLVQFGKRQLIGMVWQTSKKPSIDPKKVRPIIRPLDDLPPMPTAWLRLAEFATSYYHHPLGAILLPTLPAPLRRTNAYTGKRSAGGPVARADKRPALVRKLIKLNYKVNSPELNNDQKNILDKLKALFNQPSTALLHGVTGSGKTEIYLRLAQQVLANNKQVLLLVPEINLTPQLQEIVQTRICNNQAELLAIMHSSLSDGDRLRMWLRASRGQAKILLGTRMALFTPMPDLGLIIVDEEHDSSYKQQEGLRYSARDLAIWYGHSLKIPVILGSATPSLETWRQAHDGHYQLFSLPRRAQNQSLPQIELIDTRNQFLENGLSEKLLQAIDTRLTKQEQSLIFINRRGYSPVLRCLSCAWLSQCKYCSTNTVLHKTYKKNLLQCHHCGHIEAVPKSCPDCGNPDIQAIGHGTQRLEEYLQQYFPKANILRIDADATRKKGSAQTLFDQVHSGQADILVGTQMIAKGHDFANLGLVGVLNSDAALFSHDFRAPERLFAQLMQVSGRAGRRIAGAQVYIQTDYPEQSVYQSLLSHDYISFANNCLNERQELSLPPYAKHALFTAQAKYLKDAISFLQQIKHTGLKLPTAPDLQIYDAVPLHIVRVAQIERAQLLIETQKRSSLHSFLNQLLPLVWQMSKPHNLRWDIEIDPANI